MKEFLETDELIERLILELDSLLEDLPEEELDSEGTLKLIAFLDQLQVAGFPRHKPYDEQSQKERDYIKSLVSKIPKNQYQ